jgi:hypothetical protein
MSGGDGDQAEQHPPDQVREDYYQATEWDRARREDRTGDLPPLGQPEGTYGATVRTSGQGTPEVTVHTPYIDVPVPTHLPDLPGSGGQHHPEPLGQSPLDGAIAHVRHSDDMALEAAWAAQQAAHQALTDAVTNLGQAIQDLSGATSAEEVQYQVLAVLIMAHVVVRDPGNQTDVEWQHDLQNAYQHWERVGTAAGSIDQFTAARDGIVPAAHELLGHANGWLIHGVDPVTRSAYGDHYLYQLAQVAEHAAEQLDHTH